MSIRTKAASAILLAAIAGAGSGHAQAIEAVSPRHPAVEEGRRQALTRVERWGLEQLLRTQQQLDYKQKFRAGTSANPDELSLLAQDEDGGVRFYVATNRHTPREVLLDLAYDPLAYVRAGVAMSLFTDVGETAATVRLVDEIGLLLSRDPQVMVRLALAENPEFPAPACDNLAVDPDPIVREKLAGNPSSTPSCLAVLAQDSVVSVQATALQHRSLPVTWLEKQCGSQDVAVRLAVCNNAMTPSDVLDSLAGDPEPKVRRAVAQHPNTSAFTLRRLAADSDPGVLVAVAAHPRADRDLLMRLARDGKDATVRVAARQHLVPLLRSEIREDVLERWDTP